MGWVINGWISGDYHMPDAGAHMDVEADGEDEARDLYIYGQAVRVSGRNGFRRGD